jgi:dTDP-4-amino-4,6-dideoxygalactose transaminase
MQNEILKAVNRVIVSGQFILNKEVAAFEKEFARYCDVCYAVGVGNGTEAILLALKALNIGPGDEVITVSHTASATICAIKMAGAKPVFVDIDARSYLMDTNLISQAVTPRTKAILPVHLYGRRCNMVRIKDIAESFGLWIIEDCCQSVGAGPLMGDIGCYSFYPTKNLGGIGDGGCVVTYKGNLADKIRRMREYGYGERFVSNFVGINSRLDEIQAAVLRVKLKYLPDELKRRLHLADYYFLQLKGQDLILPDREGTFHQFVVRSKKRDRLVEELKLQIHYPVPCHLQPAYKDYSQLPVTEMICKEIVSLPMRLTCEEADNVCTGIKAIV